jgi:hypothetical protein
MHLAIGNKLHLKIKYLLKIHLFFPIFMDK